MDKPEVLTILTKRKSVTFKHDAVLVTQTCDPSTPIYTALSFLLKQENPDECLVMIYTAIEKEYGPQWEEDPKCTRIQFDEWLLENGVKGQYARLFQRIQIVEVENLEQVATTLAVFPSSHQKQQVPSGPMMIIIHDMSRVEQERSPFETSLDPLVQVYLMIVCEALGCIRLAGDGGVVILFDSVLDPPVIETLRCYLKEEQVVMKVENGRPEPSVEPAQRPKKADSLVEEVISPSY